MTCSSSSNCLNNTKCFHCCYDDDKFSEFGEKLYNPLSSVRDMHPIEQARIEKNRQEKLKQKQEQKLEKQKQRKQDKIANEKTKDKTKTKIIKEAAKTEARVKATINSGRANQDSDLRSRDLTIDVKQQSRSKDWTAHREEFIKVQSDAQRGNRKHGVLAIVNSLDECVYVISPELFLILLDSMEE